MRKKNQQANDPATKRMRWIARIWGAFIVVYSLVILLGYGWNLVTTGEADPHAIENYPPIENLGPALMLTGALGLGVAWRWEGLGGTITASSQLGFLIFSLIRGPIALDRRFLVPLLISIIVLIPGILFLVCWRRSRRPEREYPLPQNKIESNPDTLPHNKT